MMSMDRSHELGVTIGKDEHIGDLILFFDPGELVECKVKEGWSFLSNI